jgi:nickel-dependent lactate racemase
MTTVLVPELPWHGTRKREISLPDSWRVEICNMAGFNRPAMTARQIHTLLNGLISSPDIRTLAKGKKEVVIIFDDMTRVTRVAQIVPFVLEQLAEAGITDGHIRFIAGLGCHGAMDRIDFVKKLGEETVERFPVYNHNAFGNCTYVSTTKTYGTRVYINEEVMKCDLTIAIGSIVPHPMRGFGGFGGGGKIILPGVSSFETIKHNHEAALEDSGHPRGESVPHATSEYSPHRKDMEEAAALAGLDVLVNCVVNMWGETVAMFAGAPVPTYAAAVRDAKTNYLTTRTDGKDVVIANAFAKASEAGIGLRIAYQGLSPRGGDAVLIANAPEGQVTHYLNGPFGRGSQQRLLPQNVNHLIVFSEYPERTSWSRNADSDKVQFCHKWGDVVHTLQEFHGDDTNVAIYPNADIQYLG